MAPDEARLEDVRAWLQKAALDLRAAEHGMSAPAARLLSDVVFHTQQVAEKAFKGFLAWHDVPFRKTQNLEELGRACVRIDATLGPIVERAAPLTE
jgi:HEPN domain-containing protein